MAPVLKRTNSDLLPLDPRSQLLLIWDCMCNWMQEQLDSGYGVTARSFGSFTFERDMRQLSPPVPELNHVGKMVESLEPCFVIDAGLAADVHRQSNTKIQENNQSTNSIFQTKKIKFLNPVPIAAACYLHTTVVVSALKAFFSAIPQLVRNNHDLALHFNFCKMTLSNKKVSCKFAARVRQVAQAALDSKKKGGSDSVKGNWSYCNSHNAMAPIFTQRGATEPQAAPRISFQLAQTKRKQDDVINSKVSVSPCTKVLKSKPLRSELRPIVPTNTEEFRGLSECMLAYRVASAEAGEPLYADLQPQCT
ncbi:uncharacterized protein LOC113147538 [Cyclospora cayetanensis]|uniref:Uncharacterized protein LOC113147538 n=1 Tax=Cyclospora cayetanensis TaxID=88456 RepID=A0A6P6S234_9EIME|nr:uncharacterized protein LOC113147538 [Cyclospora cayetanensis]